jgi:hypothetical protein
MDLALIYCMLSGDMAMGLYVLIRYQISLFRGRSSHDRIVVGFITTYAMSITTKVVSSNPAQARCTRYNIM